MASAGLMVIDRLALFIRGGVDVSVTVKETDVVPAAVGVPVIWPPALIARTKAAGGEGGAGLMVIDRLALFIRGGVDVSVTVKETDVVPAAVGVPVIWPPAL